MLFVRIVDVILLLDLNENSLRFKYGNAIEYFVEADVK